MRQRRLWKTFCLRSSQDYRHLQSAWQSSTGSVAAHKRMYFEGLGWIETNLSYAELRALGRFAGISMPWGQMATDTASSRETEAAG